MTNRTSNPRLSLLFQFVLVALFAAIFASLGLWQWDRAAQHKELEAELNRIASSEVVGINSVLKPIRALDGEVANRNVSVRGRYLQFFLASNQSSGSTFQVGLMEVEGSRPRAAILVARQVSADLKRVPSPSDLVDLTARILPTQREDLDPSAKGVDGRLSRIDSALLVERRGATSLALYDGFLLLRDESIDGRMSTLNLIPDQIAEPTIPGFYWQHISYVIIWFLMAALVLYLPFYQLRRNKLLSSELVKGEGESG